MHWLEHAVDDVTAVVAGSLCVQLMEAFFWGGGHMVDVCHVQTTGRSWRAWKRLKERIDVSTNQSAGHLTSTSPSKRILAFRLDYRQISRDGSKC